MNSTKYSKSSNIDAERKYKSFWKRTDMNISHFSRQNTPISQFLEENNKKSNFITFANIDIKKISSENFNRIIENIISFLNKPNPENAEKNTVEENINISREALLNLMRYGLKYYKSGPIINLLLSLKNYTESSKKTKINDYDYDDLIIFYLKQICENFEKFDDILESMILLSEYLSKNFIKTNSDENDSNSNSNSNNKLLNQSQINKTTKSGKENTNEKKNLNLNTITDNNDYLNKSSINHNINMDSKEGLFDT